MIAAYALLIFIPASPAPVAAAQAQLRAWSEGLKPAFVLSDLQGEQRALPREAGGLVLVHFFATWCEPCREELASLDRLADVQSVSLSILAVNVGEVPGRVRRFLEGTPLSFPVLLDSDRAVTKAWTVHALPTTFVLDRQLIPRLFVEGDLDWTSADVVAALARVAAETATGNSESINREESK